MIGVWFRFPLGAVPLLAGALVLASPSAGLFGDWQTPTGSIIRVEQCGVKVCLLIEKLPRGVPERDIHNPDAALHDRPLCGLQIGQGFALADANHASGGTLYDPKTGKTYHGQMSAEGDELHLRGYIGVPFLGESQTWKRLAAPVKTCSLTTTPGPSVP